MFVTIDDLKMGIVSALKAMYPEVAVVSEGLDAPPAGAAFQVAFVEGDFQHESWKRFKKTARFVIRYYSDQTEKLKDCYQVAESLNEGLEFVKAQDADYRTHEAHMAMKEGVLHYTVQFITYAFKEDAAQDPMGLLDVKEGVKHG